MGAFGSSKPSGDQPKQIKIGDPVTESKLIFKTNNIDIDPPKAGGDLFKKSEKVSMFGSKVGQPAGDAQASAPGSLTVKPTGDGKPVSPFKTGEGAPKGSMFAPKSTQPTQDETKSDAKDLKPNSKPGTSSVFGAKPEGADSKSIFGAKPKEGESKPSMFGDKKEGAEPKANLFGGKPATSGDDKKPKLGLSIPKGESKYL